MEITQQFYNASLIIMWLVSIILFPTLFGIMKSKKAKWGNFWYIWIAFVLVTGVLLILFTTSPDKVATSLSKVGLFIKGIFGK